MSTRTSTHSRATAFRPRSSTTTPSGLRAEILRVPDVNKVDFIADQEQHVYMEIANAELAKLGLTVQQIADAVNTQNAVAGAGVFNTADDQVYVRPSGQLKDADGSAETLVRVNGRMLHLATSRPSRRGYADPPTEYMRFEGQNVLGIGVTMAPVRRCDRARQGAGGARRRGWRRAARGAQASRGIEHAAGGPHSVDDFIEAVAEAIADRADRESSSAWVCVPVWWWRSRSPLVLAATALCMYLFHIGLHKVSLGTLVLALGLLVDDAISRSRTWP